MHGLIEKSVVDKIENKQIHFTESEAKDFVRRYDKNGENAIFRTLDDGTSILGEIYDPGNNCRNKGKNGSPVCAGWTILRTLNK
jgi:hypothetical protein